VGRSGTPEPVDQITDDALSPGILYFSVRSVPSGYASYAGLFYPIERNWN
jgi:hypothetical protein